MIILKTANNNKQGKNKLFEAVNSPTYMAAQFLQKPNLALLLVDLNK